MKTLHRYWESFSWIVYTLILVIGIHIAESIARLKTFDTFFSWETQLWLQPIYFFQALGSFWGLRKATKQASFLTWWATFMFLIVVSRLLINYYAHEPFNFFVGCGVGALIYGLYLTTQRETERAHCVIAVVALSIGLFCTFTNTAITISPETHGGWWIFYIFAAALIAALWEFLVWAEYCGTTFTSMSTLRYMIPISLVLNCALFYGYREAQPSFIFAWAVFSFFDVVFRIINNYLLKQPFKLIHALGMALILLGTALTYIGGS